MHLIMLLEKPTETNNSVLHSEIETKTKNTKF